MSAAHNRENTTGVNGTRYGIGNRPPISHPQNCSQECPYGHDRSFCFPCYKKLVEGTVHTATFRGHQGRVLRPDRAILSGQS